ncbi:MAG: mechanosensitive ion channel family protein [Pseudomonadota bacterium]
MDISPISQILDTLDSMAEGFFARLPQLGLALGVLLVTFIVARILRAILTSVMQKIGMRQALQTLATNLIGIAAWILGFAIAITIVFPSIKPVDLIAALGLTSVAIGFAFKDVFENFLAGVLILAREKMRIGDFIECDDVFGKIEHIQIRESHVRHPNGELIIVPNSVLFKNPVTIQTDKDERRHELLIGVDYDADLNTVRSVLSDALKTCSLVNQDRDQEIVCVGFGGSSIGFKLLWWSQSTPKEQRQSYNEVAFAVWKALLDAGIDIPFPQQTLSFRDEATPIPLKQTASEIRQQKTGVDA